MEDHERKDEDDAIEVVIKDGDPDDVTKHNNINNIGHTPAPSSTAIARSTSMDTTTLSQVSRPETAYIQKPKDYAFLSLFACLICFIPFGIIGYCMSYEVRKRVANGEFAKAEKASKCAFQMSIIAIVSGIILITLIIGLVLVFM
ncbi:uncharacterized protein LOC144437072 [Glandiceps talaboti]